MSFQFTCPNPACGQAFDGRQMTVGAVYACPRCSVQFAFPGLPRVQEQTQAYMPQPQ